MVDFEKDEPVDPTESTAPAAPQAPVAPQAPIAPQAPVAPQAPEAAEGPADLDDPIDPVDPIDPIDPIDPVDPVDPVTATGWTAEPFGSDSDAAPVRQQSWAAAGPAELELSVDVGRITVHLDEQGPLDDGSGTGAGGEVRVEVRHDPASGSSWTQGISGVLSWLGTQTSGQGSDLAADAVRATEITWSEAGRRLVVRSPRELPLRMVPLAITVTAPPTSRLSARAGAGDVRVTGDAGWAAVRSGSGEASVQAVSGDADVTTGSGAIDIGPIAGRARVRTGSGAIRVGGVGGTTEIKSGSGDVTVGEVAAALRVRTGSGDITLADTRSGSIDLTSGSGALYVGLHPGVAAELDLTSGSGRVRSDLEVGDRAPAQADGPHVRGRTGSGNVLVSRSTVTV